MRSELSFAMAPAGQWRSLIENGPIVSDERELVYLLACVSIDASSKAKRRKRNWQIEHMR